MRVLFATGGAYVPETFGGAECSMDELARALGERAHACTVVGGSRRRRDQWLRGLRWRFAGTPSARDRLNGYPTVRTNARLFGRVLAEQIQQVRPDVVVTWNAGCVQAAQAARDAGVPALVWVPDMDFDSYVHRLPAEATVAGSSRFVAGRLSARRGRPAALLRPLVRLDSYRAPDLRPEHVTMIDPRPHKGVDVTLAVAAVLRHRPFTLVESKVASVRQRLELRARVRVLPNVTLLPPQPSLRAVYARTAVLLVASQVHDASPRVILEAHVNGIPVVGSRAGGIPEVMGDGGALCARDAPPAAWADAIEAVLADRPRLGALAVANAARAELSPAAVLADFLALAQGRGSA